MGLWTTWFSGRWSYSWQGFRTWWSLRSFQAKILWFDDTCSHPNFLRYFLHSCAPAELFCQDCTQWKFKEINRNLGIYRLALVLIYWCLWNRDTITWLDKSETWFVYSHKAVTVYFLYICDLKFTDGVLILEFLEILGIAVCSRSVYVKSLSAPCCGLFWEPASAVYQYYGTKERYPAAEHLSTTCFLFPCLHLSEATTCSTGITTRSSSIQGWILVLTLPDGLSHHHSSLQCFQSKFPFKTGSVVCGHLFQEDVKSKEHVTVSHHKLMTKPPISIQLPESKRPKDSFLLCSLIIFLDRSLWVQLSHIFLCIITSCQVSKHWQSHHTSQFTQNIFECHIPTFPNTPSHCTLSTC